MSRKRVAPDMDQPVLSTDVDTHDGETAYDIGLRHGTTDHEYYPDTLPAKERQAYSRGYTRGQQQRVKKENPTRWRDRG